MVDLILLMALLRKIHTKYKVTHRVASPYHPRASEQVELSNWEIKTIFAEDGEQVKKRLVYKTK
jgi:hypothetical protein